jgi:hypothetical protein
MIASLRARLLKLEAARPSPVRRFMVCAGTRDRIAPALIAALEVLGEVTVVTSGVPRDPLDEGAPVPVVYELVGDAWLLAEQDLAA